jgi:hypothetical protein
MTASIPVGPYRQIPLKNGRSAPFYMMPFDEDGLSTARKTKAHLVDDAKQHGYSNIYIFSHGWNTDFETALSNYTDFVRTFQSVTPMDGPLLQPSYQPLLVGITWPSIDLQFPWESGPGFAATNPNARPPDFDRSVRTQQEELHFVAGLLPAAQRAEFYELAASDQPMTELEAVKLAGMMAPLYAVADDPIEPDGAAPTPDDLVEFWRTAVMDAKSDASSAFGSPAAKPSSLPLGLPDPRDAIRVFTVWKMKDRAGKVGATGVRELLRDLLKATPSAKVHLVGHSFGCKVLLSAAGVGEPLPRPVTSALLLQPAVNCYCFAANVAGQGFQGGYRPTMPRIEQPILTTFSSHDMPLTKVFHLALRRKTDLGETKIFGVGAPSEFAALGGFGPQGCPPGEAVEIDIKPVGERYALERGAPEIYGIKGDTAIDGHGGVINQATAWALYCQVTAGMR